MKEARPVRLEVRSLMASTSIWLAAVAAAPFTTAAQSMAPELPDSLPVAGYAQQVLLKNYALSYCFSRIAHDEAAIQDATASAGAYFEFGHLGPQAYEQVRVLADQFVALKYFAKPEPGTVPPELNTMKCIDLFHSTALDRLTKRLVRAKAP